MIQRKLFPRTVSEMILILVWLLLANLGFAQVDKESLQEQQSEMVIPEEFRIYDTIIVFDPSTFTETFTVTTRDSRIIDHSEIDMPEFSGETVSVLDTLLIFDSQTFKESMQVIESIEPKELSLVWSALNLEERSALEEKYVSKRTVLFETHNCDCTSDLWLDKATDRAELSLINENGEEVWTYGLEPGQVKIEFNPKNLIEGNYEMKRSDGFQTIQIRIKP